MSDDDWKTVYPKPTSMPIEVELVGGPRCGERRKVPDADELVFVNGDLLAPGADRYRRRPFDAGSSSSIVKFDFDYPKPVRA